MARRRLLTILAASAVLSTSFAGPAAALELADGSQDSLVEATQEPFEVTQDAVEATEQVVEDVASAAVEETVEVVEEVASEVAVTGPATSEPEAQPEPAQPPASSGSAEATPGPADEPADDLRAAGEVTAAPPLALLTGTGGSAPTPTPQARLDIPQGAFADTPVAPATDEVEAPQVAAAPAEAGGSRDGVASVVTDAAARAAQEQGVPTLVLVAIVSLLAAGTSTLREARATATARA